MDQAVCTLAANLQPDYAARNACLPEAKLWRSAFFASRKMMAGEWQGRMQMVPITHICMSMIGRRSKVCWAITMSDEIGSFYLIHDTGDCQESYFLVLPSICLADTGGGTELTMGSDRNNTALQFSFAV